MSVRHVQDVRTLLPPAPLPNLRPHVPRRLTRNTLAETTGVTQVLNGHMFTDVTPDEVMALPLGYRTPYWHLRMKFRNSDLWDTLTEEVVDMMLNPPAEYDPDYQRQVNVAMLTCIKTLDNKLRP
tara:strand:- start:1605 stop:1979 length:375 start_codon:yes stop_codon:yes gene_type:complete